VKNLKAQIANFGLSILADYDAKTQAAMGQAEATLASEQAALAADNLNLQESLTAHTKNAIEIIIAAREALQTSLDEAQEAQEERDEEACDVLKVALVTTKNSLWKDISWLTRKQYAAGGYGHGHHGRGYGKDHKNHHDIKNSELNYHDDDHHDYHASGIQHRGHHGHHDSHA
jgi:hypothetical protein